MKTIYGIYGAGGYGREVYPLVREQLKNANIDSKIYFVADESEENYINGVDVLSFNDFELIIADEKK